jgi:hypothetical protein
MDKNNSLRILELENKPTRIIQENEGYAFSEIIVHAAFGSIIKKIGNPYWWIMWNTNLVRCNEYGVIGAPCCLNLKHELQSGDRWISKKL